MFRFAGALALLFTLMAAPSEAQRGPATRWVPLGSASVGFLVDRDVIRVGRDEAWFRNEGPFRQLRFTVERNAIFLSSIRVVYLNGFSEQFQVNREIRPGTSFNLDLRGDRSYLQQIEMVYRSKPNFRGQAVMRVDGQAVARRPGPVAPRVELLGRQKVGFLVDRDVIRVGAKEGRFRRIALKAVGNDIEVLSLRVIYGNGAPDAIPVNRVIRAGQQSGPLDLQGATPRAIDRIEMIYRSRPSFRGQATVEVYGVH